MKRTVMVVALGISTALAAHAQNIVGDWQGTLGSGQTKLHLVLHINKGDDGGYKATLDSIDQGANGIPVSSVSLKGSKLNLTVDAVNGTYEGDVNADATQIAGTWTQGQPLPLTFMRGVPPANPEPKPAKPSDIDGTWQGTVDVGGTKVRIVFHVTNTLEGLRATMDSPDQGAAGIRATAVKRSGQSLTVEMETIGGKFEGKIADNLQSIDGTWSQGGGSVPLLLKR